MNAQEFHKLNSAYFSQLEDMGYRRLKYSKWLNKSDGDVGVEFALRLERNGWAEKYGSSFIYEVLPWKNEKPVNYFPAKQLRLHELLTYDPQIVEKSVKILNRFSSKLPSIASEEYSELYIFLRSGWTKQKVEDHIGDWYYFYDDEDVLAWHNAVFPSLLLAISDLQAEYKNMDFGHRTNKTFRSDFETKQLKIDPNSGTTLE